MTNAGLLGLSIYFFFIGNCSALGDRLSTCGRDPLAHPFASSSIWNMPIGKNAKYVAANLSGTPGRNPWAGMPFIDEERIVLTPEAPLVTLNHSDAAWTGKNRCIATGGRVVRVPMPKEYVVPNSSNNNSAAFLLRDGRTVVQTQPLARCSPNSAGTTLVRFDDVDLFGNGISGAHGGSGLSALGGTIRLGELRPNSRTGPRHALKVNVFAKEALFRCSTRQECFQWPATTADSDAVGNYGTATNNRNSAMKMGALLAIPFNIDISSLGLTTKPAMLLAWTLQQYGAYIVDDTAAAGFALNVEAGPAGSKRKEFKSDWGFEMAQKLADDTPWRRDVQKLVQVLHVVSNNGPEAVGGGGGPRQPLAPPISPRRCKRAVFVLYR